MKMLTAVIGLMLFILIVAPSFAGDGTGFTAPRDAESALWASVRDSDKPSDIKKYLKAYPKGIFSAQARMMLTQMDSGEPDAGEQASRDAAIARVKLMERQAKLKPKDPSAWNQLGIAYAENAEADKAIKAFQQGIRLSPKHAGLLNNLGNAYFIKRKFTSAVKSYELSLKTDPKDPETLVNLSRAYLKADDFDHARETFLKAYRLNPKVKDVYPGLSMKLLGD